MVVVRLDHVLRCPPSESASISSSNLCSGTMEYTYDPSPFHCTNCSPSSYATGLGGGVGTSAVWDLPPARVAGSQPLPAPEDMCLFRVARVAGNEVAPTLRELACTPLGAALVRPSLAGRLLSPGTYCRGPRTTALRERDQGPQRL